MNANELTLSLRCLNEPERAILDTILNNTALWLPQSGPQLEALLNPADELLYGGAAGGGKTDLLIGLAVTQHKKSIIFRREYPQLKDVVLRSVEILGDTRSRFNGQSNIWRNIPGGRSLEFGAVQYLRDVNKFKGRPHDLKAFDEVTEFLEEQYRFLIGWARTTDPRQRVRVVAASNPPTHADGEWVIRYWGPWLDDQYPHPARPGELRWFAVLDGKDEEVENGQPFEFKGETVIPRSRSFIPARLSDNPYLSNTDYGAVLQGMPEPLRSQLLYGDFNVGREDDPWQVIPTDWVRQAMARWTPQSIETLDALGVDVARGGKDQTVIAPRRGTWFGALAKYAGKQTPDGPSVAVLVIQVRGQSQAHVNIDVIGIGSSAYDSLKGSDIPVTGVNFGEASQATDRSGQLKMRNLRAEAWWDMREALDPTKGDGLALPPDNELLADLTAPHWKPTTQGIQIEDKEEIRVRIGRSPDCGDAIVLAHFIKALPWRDIPFLKV